MLETSVHNGDENYLKFTVIDYTFLKQDTKWKKYNMYLCLHLFIEIQSNKFSLNFSLDHDPVNGEHDVSSVTRDHDLSLIHI